MKTKVLFYCTKALPDLVKSYTGEYYVDYMRCFKQILNGKIVCECEVECEEIINWDRTPYTYYYTKSLYEEEELLAKSQLNKIQLEEYISNKGYALHISNLKVFDNPICLENGEVFKHQLCGNCEYRRQCKKDAFDGSGCMIYEEITKAPQNMMWVWYKTDRYCLISIRPEWLCKILNGEKTIEVRKKILKGMM